MSQEIWQIKCLVVKKRNVNQIIEAWSSIDENNIVTAFQKAKLCEKPLQRSQGTYGNWGNFSHSERWLIFYI